jgi:hypothetical protein
MQTLSTEQKSDAPKRSKPPEELLSTNVLSRRLDINYARLKNLVHRGVIKPDFVSQETLPFRPSRVAQIQIAIKKHEDDLADDIARSYGF